ncbi:retinol dehydrogenase 11-like [Penaeus chinensis]|uniref:retinol dehydrogenase 11-like n=1 Tax=Penaeus chinensis TaxID=139456 RepID=UPI001FB80BB6|nr:retinol dehydrogenase 11-like [Penaeus chinensis]XP_047476154.1 retinol dehydrogenase 11-like [Penaeus chinensis]XP_047476155.1 retinol dehydrogenase 11-like [Penaeus chinensis]
MFMMEDPSGGRESLVLIMGEDVLHTLLRLVMAWVFLLPWMTLVSVVVFVGVWVGKRLTAARCTSSRRMDGKTVVITGGESGLGKEVAKDLVRRGADVIIAGIDKIKAFETRDELAGKEGSLETAYLDLSKMASVRQFAKTMEGRKIDVLLNNAGVADLPQRLTKEGLEFTVATNHLGHFLLTHLLMPGLKKARGKVVTVTSICHKHVRSVDDLDLTGRPQVQLRTRGRHAGDLRGYQGHEYFVFFGTLSEVERHRPSMKGLRRPSMLLFPKRSMACRENISRTVRKWNRQS